LGGDPFYRAECNLIHIHQTDEKHRQVPTAGKTVCFCEKSARVKCLLHANQCCRCAIGLLDLGKCQTREIERWKLAQVTRLENSSQNQSVQDPSYLTA